MSAKILAFPSRDPYADFSETDLGVLLRASIQLQARRCTTDQSAATQTITPQGTLDTFREETTQ
jgi:hypothetical protein